MKTYVVGHQNPDTDSICAAVTYANLRKELGEEVEAIRSGKINAETEFVLDKFEVEAPKLVKKLKGDEKVVLVDHNEMSQAISGLDMNQIVGIVDHHRLGGIETDGPIFFKNETVGSTCTIITKLYKENGVEVSDQMAGLLLSAILSDTVIFRSPTCTDVDKEIAKELAKRLDLDIEKYGIELFKAGSVISTLSPREIIENDYKEYEFAGDLIGVGQIEIMSLSEIDEVKEDLLEAIEEIVEEKGYKFLVLMVTDIIAEGSLLLFNNEANSDISQAFSVDVKETEVYLDAVLSRKKQVVPVLSDYLA
ncbi:manganese-dependent inorganic pyrophosphatase [Halonatronum saccharophilum]|uniref:manganese-dependent inorganic pyrophosphatase n=1 Tax=Halonatronum saccharophilum TaxID=150060 RepID=UPI000489A2F4|nr:manganese-dependent inorganic pyrophosphatase [Halonatronum saccharophilum]